MSEATTNADLEREARLLREENALLRAELELLRAREKEPEEVVRAIRDGEIDAVVVAEDGQETIYSLQTYDTVYRSVVEECFPYGVWLAETNGRLLYVSASFLGLLRTSLEEIREKGQFHFLPPESREVIERSWETCRQTCTTFNAEYTASFADGVKRTIWTHGLLAKTADGHLRWVGVNIDVTDRRKIEDELQRHAEALQDADRRKDEFLALLGHELRNPLAAIRNGLHILLMPSANAAALGQVKEMMEAQVRHLNRLVDDLLDISRITRGKIELRKEKLELRAVIRHALDAVRSLVDTQQHQLLASLPEHPIYLEADPTRLGQVLVNLLTNAAKYTPRGGRIEVAVECVNDEALIRFRDDGIGIPSDLLPKVFDLFIQGERGLDRSGGGLGIGLTLVKRLVEMHGGRVQVQSAGLDKGSEFIVYLPILQGTLHSEPQPTNTAAIGGDKMRVLVVDDAVDGALSLEILLDLWGHEVRVVHDGLEALREYRTYQPEVILLDIGLPGMSGYEVAREIRAGQASKRPLIVAMSGYGQEEDKRRSTEAGCDLHMTKPVNPNELNALLNTARTG